MNDPCIRADERWSDPHLRIALVTETYPPEINGVAMTLERMVAGLIARGHRVELIRPRQGRADEARRTEGFDEVLAHGCKLPHYDGLRFGFPARAFLTRLWSRERPDLVHVATEGPLGWSAVSVATRLRIPVTSDFHTNFDHYSGHYGLGWLRQPVTAYLRRFHNRTARTLVPTAAVARTLKERGYQRVAVVARGVDTALFRPDARLSELRRDWGVADNEPVVLYVGRLAAEKNLGLAVRAFQAIVERTPDARMVFVGDGPLRAELSSQMPEAIFAGMRTGEDLAAHYASADVFLFPSLTETFGNVSLEALASGLALVAYRCAAAAELVCDEENGLLANAGDEVAFVAQAVRAASDRPLRARLASGARALACEQDWGAVNDRFSAELVSVWAEAADVADPMDGGVIASGGRQ